MNYHNPVGSGLIAGVPLTALMDSDRLGRDIHYMKQYYPKQVLRLAEITELIADRYDKPRSFFYDEFPDRISMLHILKEITDAYRTEQALDAAKREARTENYEAPAQNNAPIAFLPDDETAAAIAELLLLQEILIRRLRRRNSPKRTFPLP